MRFKTGDKIYQRWPDSPGYRRGQISDTVVHLQEYFIVWSHDPRWYRYHAEAMDKVLELEDWL